MKKLLLFIALTIFGLGLNAQSVGDETTIDYDGYSLKFKITSVEPAECEVSGYTDSPTDVIIQSAVTISGTEFNVTSIGSRVFTDCLSLTSIEIPNSVTSIGERAFYSSKLKSIRCLSDSVPALGKYVFDRSSIRQIQVPEESIELYKAAEQWNTFTIIKIYPYHYGDYVIEYDNYSLGFTANPLTDSCDVVCEVKPETNTAITIPSTIELAGCMVTVSSIRSSAFEDCLNLTSIEIPNSVTSIGSGAFRDCSSLTSTEIPNSVTSIGSSAFNGCSSLTSITFGDNPQLTSIGKHAFFYCESLTNIEIPSSVNTIGEKGFDNCSSLTSIEIPNSVTSIGSWAFSRCSSLTSIVVAEGNTVYDSRENCNAIIETSSNTLTAGCQNTVIPNSVTEIGYGAFSGCSSLTSIDIPSSVTSIGNSAFSGCSNLTSIEISNSVTSIGQQAFNGCSSLTSIEIPSSVTSILGFTFSYCSSLTSIEIPSSVTSIGQHAFYRCSSLTSITFGDNPQLTSIGVYAFSDCSSLTSIEIPNSVTSIGNSAFFYCSSLTSIEIPNSVTSIGNSAFFYCSSLTSIEIPNSVTSIGWSAFSECSSLKVIKCYAENVPETVYDVFYKCPSDMIIYVPENSVEDYKETSPWNAFTILSLNEGPRNITATTESVSSVNLSWDNCYADSYNVYRNGDSIANVTNPTYTDIDLEYNTEYCYTVTAVRNETESDKSEEKCVKTFDLPITTPENLVAEALSTSSISLSWNEVENALSYNVYRDGEMIINVTNTNYTDNNLEYNTEYCYTVTAVRNETESDKSEEKCAKTLGESINELLSSSINIYPNPVENDLFIATEVRVNEVSIYDVYGRLCCRDASNASTSNSMDTFNVSVQDLEAGVYFVNVKTENGNIVKRFVKK